MSLRTDLIVAMNDLKYCIDLLTPYDDIRVSMLVAQLEIVKETMQRLRDEQ